MNEFDEICAKFLGWKLIKEDNYFKWLKPNGEKIGTFKPLGFDTDWNLIHQVIEKIETLNVGNNHTYQFNIGGTIAQLDGNSFTKPTKKQAVITAINNFLLRHKKYLNI